MQSWYSNVFKRKFVIANYWSIQPHPCIATLHPYYKIKLFIWVDQVEWSEKREKKWDRGPREELILYQQYHKNDIRALLLKCYFSELYCSSVPKYACCRLIPSCLNACSERILGCHQHPRFIMQEWLQKRPAKSISNPNPYQDSFFCHTVTNTYH